MPVEIRELLVRYLAQAWQAPVEVSGVRRFHGGSARETFRFDAASRGTTRGLVLRRDPASSLIETDRSIEFAALQAFHGSAVPVPEPLLLDTGDALGSPGFIMAEVPGVRAAGLFDAEPYGDAAASVGRQLFTILGHIHCEVPRRLAELLPLPADPAAARLDHWRRTIVEDALGPEPVAWAAIRWLERHLPPPPDRPGVVHGDYRSGNFLYDGAMTIRAIVDWEMVHLGDVHEDLGWVMDPLWAHGSGRPAATLLEAAALAAWEAASGRRVDPGRLRWWRVFAQLAGLAIWISSAKEIAAGRSTDPVLVYAGLYPYRFHNAALARTLRDLAA